MTGFIAGIMCFILAVGTFIISFFSFRKRDLYSIMRIYMLQRKNEL